MNVTYIKNYYPIFSSNFLSDGLTDFWSIKQESFSALTVATCEYPYAVRDTFRCVLQCGEKQINENFSGTLCYFGDGIFCLETIKEIDIDKISLEQINDLAEYERGAVNKWLKKDRISSELRQLENEIYGLDDNNKSFVLGGAYSHNLIISDRLCSDSIIPCLLQSGEFVEREGEWVRKAFCTPSVNAFWLEETYRTAVLDLLRTLTVVMSTLYEVQSSAKSQSRDIVEKHLVSGTASQAAAMSAKRLAHFEQFTAEMGAVDFLADPLEVTVGQSVADVWGWNDLVSQTQCMVSHMSSQIARLNEKVTREFEDRVAKILFGFTLLTVINVTSGAVAFYDIENSVAPFARILSMVLSLLVTILFVLVYLKRSRGKP